MSKMLEFNDVELFYDHVYALKGVSIDLEKGETVALIGANGAGKSSILRAITGLAAIRSGSIRFENEDITGPSGLRDRRARHCHGARGPPRLPLHVRQGQSPDGRVHPFRTTWPSGRRWTASSNAFHG